MYRNQVHQSMQRARQHSRLRDIQESQSLLLELVTSEPTILQCFKIIESTCLSQGIFCRIQGTEVSPKFQRFLEDHYLPFCKTAVRAMYTYGFVPWRTRRLANVEHVVADLSGVARGLAGGPSVCQAHGRAARLVQGLRATN